MKKFVETAKRITAIIGIVTGFVLAIGAALEAFSVKMKEHYPEEKPQQNSNEGTNS